MGKVGYNTYWSLTPRIVCPASYTGSPRKCVRFRFAPCRPSRRWCAGDLENAVIGAGGEIELTDGHFEEGLGVGLERAEFAHVLGTHGGIAMDLAQSLESFLLDVVGNNDTFPDFCGWLTGAQGRRLMIADGRHFNVDINSVEQGTGYLIAIIADLLRRTSAFALPVAVIATGAGIHGRDQHKVEELAFLGKKYREIPLVSQGEGTTTYVVSGLIAVLRLFRNIGLSKIGPSRNGNYWKLRSFGIDSGTPRH